MDGEAPLKSRGRIFALTTLLAALTACAQQPVPPPAPAYVAPPIHADTRSAALAVYATAANGAPLKDALVYLHAVGGSSGSAAPSAAAALDILERRFQPEVLA